MTAIEPLHFLILVAVAFIPVGIIPFFKSAMFILTPIAGVLLFYYAAIYDGFQQPADLYCSSVDPVTGDCTVDFAAPAPVAWEPEFRIMLSLIGVVVMLVGPLFQFFVY